MTQFKTGDVKLATVDPIRLWHEDSADVKAVDVVRGQCGPPSPTPPLPTKRIPDIREIKDRFRTDAPGEGPGSRTSRSQVAIIVVVVLILVLVIIALLVLIYWYWSRHKGTYHTHEDDENLQNAEPFIELQHKQPPPSDGGDTQKKKEWYIWAGVVWWSSRCVSDKPTGMLTRICFLTFLWSDEDFPTLWFHSV